MASADSLSTAQIASLRSLTTIANLALDSHGRLIVRVREPERMHPGEYAPVLVKVESWDPTIRDLEDPTGMQRSQRTFLIEAGGCIAEVHV